MHHENEQPGYFFNASEYFKNLAFLGGLDHVRWEQVLCDRVSRVYGFSVEWPGSLQQHVSLTGIHSAWAHLGPGASKAADQPLSRDPLLICPGKRGVDTPLRALAGSQAGVPVVKAIGRGTLGAVSQILPVLAPCTTILLKSSWALLSTEFLCQGDVTNPKAVKEETSNQMLICRLCNNVTKILMMKS